MPPRLEYYGRSSAERPIINFVAKSWKRKCKNYLAFPYFRKVRDKGDCKYLVTQKAFAQFNFH